MTDRGTGKTTRMLQEALANRGSAASYPMLIYGANMMEVDRLRRQFVQLAREDGAEVTQEQRHLVVLDGCEEIWFRSYHDGDSPMGVDFCHIYRDHYAMETHDG